MVLVEEPARWLHQDGPVTHNDRTELWHTRLTTSKEDFGPDNASNVRAIWSEDYLLDEEEMFSFPKSPPSPFRMSLDFLDRKMLVKLMSGFNEKTEGKPYKPLSSKAERLHLTALGALLDVEGNWPAHRPDEIDLQQWRHLSTLGRDHYVRVVRRLSVSIRPCGLPYQGNRAEVRVNYRWGCWCKKMCCCSSATLFPHRA